MQKQNFHHLEKSNGSSKIEIKQASKLNRVQTDSRLEDSDSAQNNFEHLASLDIAESKVWQGIKLEQANKLPEAIECYRQAVKLNSQSAVAHHILAIALKKQNNLVEADYYHRLALSLSKEYHNPSWENNSKNPAKQANNKSQDLSSQSNTDLVIDRSNCNYNSRNSSVNLTISSSNIVLPKLTAVAPGTYVENNQLEVTKIYLQQAKLYYSDARWQESIDACEEALKICSDIPETYKIYGNSLQQMGKVPEAMGYYARALTKDPHLAEVYANIGSLHAKQNDWQSAISYYQKALNIDPKQAKICLHLSKAWEKIGEDDRALDALFQALSIRAEILTVAQYMQLADDLLAEGKIQLAISCCQQGIKIQPPAKDLYLKLIYLLERDGRVEQAAGYRQIIANWAENGSPKKRQKLSIQKLLNSTTTKYLPADNAEHHGASERHKLVKHQQQLDSSVVEESKLLPRQTSDDASVAEYLEQLKQQPDSSTIALKLANLFARQQQWQQALVYYQRVITIEPNLAIAHLRLGKVYGIIGRHFEGAEAIYRAYSLQPEIASPEQHYKLGEFWLAQHKGKVAMSCYRRALQLKPGFQAAYERLKQLIALQTQQTAQLTEAQTAESQDREYYQQAIAAVKAGDWQQAAQYYQQAIEIAPQESLYYYNLGEVQQKLDRWQEAIQTYQQAAQLEPNNADIQHNLGEIYSHEVSWENAVEAYQKAIAIGTKNSWTYHNLGYGLLQLQQWESAADAFTKAIAIKDDFVWSHYNLGEALANLGRWDEALAAYHAAQKIEPDLSEVKTKIGGILYQRSQQFQRKALSFCKSQIARDPGNVELYHQAISLDKQDPQLYLGLGRVLVEQGKTEEALSIYQIGLQIQPQNPELIRECDRLRGEHVTSSANITAKVESIVSSNSTYCQAQDSLDVWQLPNHPSPTVSIIVPVYNQINYTVKCLHSIAQHISKELQLEVIAVNDCSTDNTVETLNRFEGLKLIDNQENLGLLHSCNQGVKSASGEYIYFLNNNTELQPGALEHLLSVLERDSDVGAVGSKLIYPDGTLQEAGGIVFGDASVWNYGIEQNASAPQYNYLRPVDYGSRASLLVKRSVFSALDGFDPDLTRAYYDDTDLCFAIRHQLGLKVMYQPKSEVVHHEKISYSTESDSPIERDRSIDRAKFAQKWAKELANYSRDSSQVGIATASRRHLGSKTVLIVDLYAPCYDKESGAHRIWELLQVLKQLDYHIIFVADNGVKEQPYVEMLQDRSIEVIYRDPAYELSVEQQLEELLPLVDLAWICRPQLYEKYAPLIRQDRRIKLVYDTVRLNYLSLQRAIKFEDNNIQSMRQWVRMQVRELKAAHEADLTITVTPVEKQILEQQEVKNIAVVPNIHRVANIEHNSFYNREGLLFIGNYDRSSNVDAVNWLVEEIMPIVWQTIPNLNLTLLGSNPTKDVTALGRDSRITVTGFISDVAPYFLNHRVFVAPLRYGAGMKGKIGQSLAYSLPVVATEIGTEGMGLIHEQNVLKANPSDEFAKQIIRLYNEESLWQQLAHNSTEALTSFSPKSVRARVQQIMNHLLDD